MIALAQDRCFTATGQEDGKPLIFRGLGRVPAGVKEADLATRVAILWRYKSHANGMPDAETNDAQIAFEDALEPLDASDTSRLMLVVTGNGRKEWHWYVKDFDAWMVLLNQRLAQYAAYPIEITYSYEPAWSLYKDFMANLGDPEAAK